jgi:hypothetical protein
MRAPGPALIGRFDLERETLASPVDLGAPESRSGVWDVLASDDERVYFTTFFDTAGFVELASGSVRRFAAAGSSLNELAPGPDGLIVASRYGGAGDGNGSVVLLDRDGTVAAEFPLEGPPGHRPAAKSVAFDPVRQEFWVNTDLLPEEPGPIRYDTRVLDRRGRELSRFEVPEVQFMAFSPDGMGYLAERSGDRISLRVVAPNEQARPPACGTPIPLDDEFPTGLDFVQDVQPGEDGVVVVTRWSGRIHLVDPAGSVHTLDLPRPDPDGLFYSAVLREGRVCATFCADVTVVCSDAPATLGLEATQPDAKTW